MKFNLFNFDIPFFKKKNPHKPMTNEYLKPDHTDYLLTPDIQKPFEFNDNIFPQDHIIQKTHITNPLKPAFAQPKYYEAPTGTQQSQNMPILYPNARPAERPNNIPQNTPPLYPFGK
jgi:hypothetical protein